MAPQGPQPVSRWHTSPEQQSSLSKQSLPSAAQHAPSAQTPPQQSLATVQTCPERKHASGSQVPLRQAQPSQQSAARWQAPPVWWHSQRPSKQPPVQQSPGRAQLSPGGLQAQRSSTQSSAPQQSPGALQA